MNQHNYESALLCHPVTPPPACAKTEACETMAETLLARHSPEGDGGNLFS